MKKLFDAFSKSGHELYEVGGCVRDTLLGVESNDLDFATSARPEETMEVLRGIGLPTIPIGIEFGTVQTIIEGEKIEITTYRCAESYTKGSRKPEVVFGRFLEEDLARRDFTFNALARDSEGEVMDFFGGESDLKAGIIRTPADPSIAFTEDPLRILRACRFAARGLGDVHVDTVNAMFDHRKLVLDLSAERVFEEMTKLLVAKDPVGGLRTLAGTEVLEMLFPELTPVMCFDEDTGKWHHLTVWDHTLEVVRNTPPIAEVRWAALFHDVAKPECWTKNHTGVHFYNHDFRGAKIWDQVARRLKISNEFREHVFTLIYEHQNLRNNMGVKGIRRLIHRLGGCLNNLFYHTAADIKAHVPRIVEPKLAELAELRRRVDEVLAGSTPVTSRLPKGTGDTIAKALGIKPGPELGFVMKRLQKMMVEGTINSSSDFVKVAKGIQR